MFDLLSNDVKIEEFFWARPLPTTAMLVIFIAIIALSIYLYRRPHGLKPWQQALLAVTRLAALLLVVATLFEPTAVIRKNYTQQRSLPVLVDVSESMSIKDQRKRPEDLVEAAAVLDLLPAPARSLQLLVLQLIATHPQSQRLAH